MEASKMLGNMDHRTLKVLAKSVNYLSCGKLKRGSELINEAARSAGNDQEELIAECRKLGLIVQSRKYISKADDWLCNGDVESALNKYQAINTTGIPRELVFHLLHNIAVGLARAGRFEESACCFQEALLRRPGHTRAMQNTAFVLMESGQYEVALRYLSDVIRADNIDPANLLYVLYCAAMCRHHIDPHGDHVAGAEQALMSMHQLTAQSPAAPDTNLHVAAIGNHATVPHWAYQNPPTVPLYIDTEDLVEPPVRIANHVPFRQIRFGGPRSATVPGLQMPAAEQVHAHISPSVDTKSDRESKLSAVIGSPVAESSKARREALQQAVHEHDKAAHPREISVTTDQSVVSAAVSLPVRSVRVPDPSPAVQVSSQPPSPTAPAVPQINVNPDFADRSLRRAEGSQVSSAKPRLRPARRSEPERTYSAQERAPAAVADDTQKQLHNIERNDQQTLPSHALTRVNSPLPDPPMFRTESVGMQPVSVAPNKPRRAAVVSDAYRPARAAGDDAVKTRAAGEAGYVAPASSVKVSQAPEETVRPKALVGAKQSDATTVAPVDGSLISASVPSDHSANTAGTGRSTHQSQKQTAAPMSRNDQDSASGAAVPFSQESPPVDSIPQSAPVLAELLRPSEDSASSSLTGTSAGSINLHAPSLRRHRTLPPVDNEPSWQQLEMERALDARRFVDQFTITNADVARLRSDADIGLPPAQDTNTFYSYDQLKTPGPFPSDVDVRFREYYLSDADFVRVMRVDKATWSDMPAWRQRSMKQALGLF